MNNKIYTYLGNEISFQNDKDVMVNATQMAKLFDKRPIDWLRLPASIQYMETLEAVRKSHRSEMVISVNGIGTWMHQDVALEFARWLSPAFAIWTNDRIKELLTSGVATINNDDETIANAMLILQKRLDTQKQRVQILESEAKEQERIIEHQRPAVVFMNAVTGTKSNILMRDMAKLLSQNGIKIGEVRLYDWMTQNKYLICSKRWSNSKQRYENSYMPSQRASDLNIFFVSSQIITAGEHSFVKHTIKITPKGQTYFINMFLKEKEIA